MRDTVPNAQARVKRPERLNLTAKPIISLTTPAWQWSDLQPQPAQDPEDEKPWDSYELQSPTLTPGKRLELLRARLMRIKSAAEMARIIGVNEVTYQHHENGTRKVSLKAASVYAAYFGVSVELLLSGAGVLVEVLGAITTGGAIVGRMHLDFALPETVYFARPLLRADEDQPKLGAYVVTDDLYPAYRRGDIVHFDMTTGGCTKASDGRECVVETEDGRRLLRVVHAAGDGRWTLMSYQQGVPPETGVSLKGCWRVRFVERDGVDLNTGRCRQ